MKVLFDVTMLMPRNLSGEGIYSKNLFRLLRGLGVDLDPVYKKPSGMKENFIEYHAKTSPKKFYGFFTSKGTILHGPSGSLLSESPKLIKVISINDMGMFREGFHEPKVQSALQAHMKQQLQCDPAAVIVPTYEVHNEFLARFPKFVKKTHVVTPGCDHLLESSNLNASRIMEKPYFLFVGTMNKQSNLAGVVKGFHGLASIQKDVQLVICGDLGYGGEAIEKLISSAATRDRIHVLGYKSDAELKQIYSGAVATVVPSLYEGFNYPLVESMKMGTPVVTSGLGSMAEVGRESAHLVNPKDAEQIMAGMERLYVDRVYREKLIEAGRAATAEMSWLSCAKGIARIYSDVSK